MTDAEEQILAILLAKKREERRVFRQNHLLAWKRKTYDGRSVWVRLNKFNGYDVAEGATPAEAEKEFNRANWVCSHGFYHEHFYDPP